MNGLFVSITNLVLNLTEAKRNGILARQLQLSEWLGAENEYTENAGHHGKESGLRRSNDFLFWECEEVKIAFRTIPLVVS